MPKPPRSKLPLALQQPIYLGVRAVVGGMQVLGPRAAGRAVRGLAPWFARSKLGRKHTRRAVGNLRVAYPEWDEAQVQRCAVRSYEHLFRLGVEVACAPRLLTEEGWMRHMTIGSMAPAVRSLLSGRPCIMITGHCGNWEVMGYAVALLGFPVHALYRPLDMVPLDRWLRGTRERRGLTLVDKFGALRHLPELVESGAPLGFVADQNGGDRGVFVPFFNRLTSTYKSIGLLALQYRADVICAFSRRLGGDGAAEGLVGEPDDFRFSMEATDVFGAEEYLVQPDPLFYLTARYRRAIESMVRSAPEQYLWMHRIWRSRPRHERLQRPFPAALREKLATLPWITADEIERLVEQSARDARTLAETGVDRLS
jgi:KDO2-lipid IV(A) lauroyltransferase